MSDPHIQDLNPGEPTPPRPAASVILLRGGGKHASAGLEVLLGQRTPNASFMASVWVFPGGGVDGDITDEQAHREAALRELEEEVGVRMTDTEALVPFSRWITPTMVKVRFDTRFYLAIAPAHCKPQPDREEIVDVIWTSPSEALERHGAGDLSLVFPTIKQLEQLAGFATAQEAIEHAASREVEPILPRVEDGENGPVVLLPGDPGY